MKDNRNFDYIIVGAGIVGLALAFRLSERFGKQSRILVLDKESAVAAHASGRNSGVLHAGFYYAADSLKAKFCVAGNRAMREFCLSRSLPINECGKLVVATDESEIPALQELARRGKANGAELELITERDALNLQPGIRSVGDVLYSPRTATADPKQVAAKLREELLARGVSIECGNRYQSFRNGVVTTASGQYNTPKLINCAGLYADKIAHDLGFGNKYTIIPFKGLYLKYKKNKSDVRMNIYPVPNPKYPFLGVHFTTTVDGTIKIGPTAIPALWRENYSGLARFSLSEFLNIGCWETLLFATNAFNFRSLAYEESRKYFRKHFIGLAKKLLPTIDEDGFGDFAPPGIRAQLLNKSTRELVQDFVVEGDSTSVHVLNAVSPGWTCSFPFADYIIEHFILK